MCVWGCVGSSGKVAGGAGRTVLGVGARRDHAEGLALPVRKVLAGLDNNVAGLTCGLGPHNALHRDYLAHVRSLPTERSKRIKMNARACIHISHGLSS